MEAITFTANTKKLELSTLPVPKITGPDQVLIKVAYSGICGTDLHIIQWGKGNGKCCAGVVYGARELAWPATTANEGSQNWDLPTQGRTEWYADSIRLSTISEKVKGEFPCHPNKTVTMGHEFSGTVVDVGSDVKIVKTGDKVAVDPNDGCRCCDFCRNGNPHYCLTGGVNGRIGTYNDGGWAEYVLAPIGQVHKIPEPITLEQAALTEPMSCLSHGWDIISPVMVGSRILVTGAGIIGNLWVCALHLQGHRKVTVSEPNTTRLNMLKNLNTGYTLITPDQLKRNQQDDPDYLFDLIIDCSGFPPAIEHAVSLLQRGGKLCCFGVAPPHGEIQIRPFDIYMKEMTIYGVNINPFSFPKAIGLMEAMGDRYLNYNHLGIKTFSLKEYKEALDSLKKGTIAKAIFKL